MEKPPVNPHYQNQFPIYLMENRRANLTVPMGMTVADMRLLRQQIDTHLAIIGQVLISDKAHPAPVPIPKA